MKKKINPGTLLGPVPVVMVTLGQGNEANIITVAWTGIVNSEPPLTYISLRRTRHSHAILMKEKEFIINLVSSDIVLETDLCGVKSGRDIDKFKECNFTKVDAEMAKCPMIDESPVNLECKVIEVKEFPTHDMFIAEIVQVHVNEDIMDESGKADFKKAKLTCYLHGEYFGLKKERIGKFGFSIMREKTKKRIQKEEHEKRIEDNRKKREKTSESKTSEKKSERKVSSQEKKGSYSNKKQGFSQKNGERKSSYSKKTYAKDGEKRSYGDKDFRKPNGERNSEGKRTYSGSGERKPYQKSDERKAHGDKKYSDGRFKTSYEGKDDPQVRSENFKRYKIDKTKIKK